VTWTGVDTGVEDMRRNILRGGDGGTTVQQPPVVPARPGL
jgi:hypothetical protein